uniref:Si:ch211-130m23.3 n=1 Tax=Echeneis naucrates TaxID=173247 RepID=A0A665TG09_ECHNA
MSDLKSQLAETSENVGAFLWSSLHPARCLQRGRESERGDQRNRTESGQIRGKKKKKKWHRHSFMCSLCAHNNIYGYTLSHTACVCSLFLPRMRKSAAAAPSPVLGNLPPGEGMPVGPVPPGFFQPFMSPRYPGGPRPPLRLPNQGLGGVPGSQPMLPSGMDPTRQQGHPNMGGPMQRMTPPRGMVPLGPQNYGGGMRPPLNALVGPGMPDSTNSGDNMYTMINTVPPGGSRPNFPMGAGGDGPLGGMAGMEPHHMNGSLGSGDMDSLPKNSPGNLSMSNQPGTPREDGEMGGNFLNPFQNESYSPNMTMSV